MALDNASKIERNGAVILAGGDSKRVGRPKALLQFNGATLVERLINILQADFNELTLITDRRELYSGLPVKLAGDLLTGMEKSPLRGIHAGLSVSDLPYQFFVACDMPLLNMGLIKYMGLFAADYDAVVPIIDSYYQPLHAYYNRSCVAAIEKVLAAGQYKVTAFYENINVKLITETEIRRYDPDQVAFTNINTWEDYEKLLGSVPKT